MKLLRKSHKLSTPKGTCSAISWTQSFICLFGICSDFSLFRSKHLIWSLQCQADPLPSYLASLTSILREIHVLGFLFSEVFFLKHEFIPSRFIMVSCYHLKRVSICFIGSCDNFYLHPKMIRSWRPPSKLIERNSHHFDFIHTLILVSAMLQLSFAPISSQIWFRWESGYMIRSKCPPGPFYWLY